MMSTVVNMISKKDSLSTAMALLNAALRGNECWGTSAACIGDFCCSRKMTLGSLETITMPTITGMCCDVAARVVMVWRCGD